MISTLNNLSYGVWYLPDYLSATVHELTFIVVQPCTPVTLHYKANN